MLRGFLAFRLLWLRAIMNKNPIQERKDRWKNAVNTFMALKNPTLEEWMTFVVQASLCFRQGAGLTQEQIETPLREAIEKKNQK